MSPLARRTVAANMGTPAQGHACATAGPDNDRKNGLGPCGGTVNGFGDGQTVGVICQTHFPVQALT